MLYVTSKANSVYDRRWKNFFVNRLFQLLYFLDHWLKPFLEIEERDGTFILTKRYFAWNPFVSEIREAWVVNSRVH